MVVYVETIGNYGDVCRNVTEFIRIHKILFDCGHLLHIFICNCLTTGFPVSYHFSVMQHLWIVTNESNFVELLKQYTPAILFQTCLTAWQKKKKKV